MFFSGREREITLLIRELGRGRHVIITGKYGIGKTTLVRHLAKLCPETPKGAGEWHFIFLDFSQTPGEMCRKLQKNLSMRRERHELASLTFRQRRSRIAVMASYSKKKHIVVLDNITSLTSQKLSLIQYFLLERAFQFIALTESPLSMRELFLLRAALIPSEVMELGYLRIEETLAVLSSVSEKNDFGWTDSHLRMLAAVTKGYPLGIREAVERELRRHRQSEDAANLEANG